MAGKAAPRQELLDRLVRCAVLRCCAVLCTAGLHVVAVLQLRPLRMQLLLLLPPLLLLLLLLLLPLPLPLLLPLHTALRRCHALGACPLCCRSVRIVMSTGGLNACTARLTSVDCSGKALRVRGAAP